MGNNHKNNGSSPALIEEAKMDFRQFRYFVTVAEELHVGRAAQKLGIAQPALSQQIQQMEQQLGFLLFNRENRRLRLTETGAIFLQGARHTLQQAEHAVAMARRCGKGELGQVRVGYVDSAIMGTVLPSMVKRFKSSHPDVDLTLQSQSITGQLASLAKDELDVAVVRGPLPPLDKRWQAVELTRDALLLCLPETHRFADDESVPMGKLRDEPFVTLVDPTGVGLAGQIGQLGEEAGFVPRVGQCAGQTATLTALVAAGLGVAILPAPLQKVQPGGVVFRSLDPAAWSVLYMISNANENRPAVMAFLHSAAEG